MSVLEVNNIKKSFGKLEVLKGLSFSLNKGEVLSIIGSSGSGKTTLLRCINFLEFADEFSWKERDKLFGSGVLLKYFNQQAERMEAGESVKISKHSFMIWLSKQEGRYGSGESYRSGGKR